ncbi:MAG: cell division protein FtsA [Neisseria sp.]|nr:cell division protein FtsA [Neisseria sp.]
MSEKQYICAVDIGTSKVIALIGEVQDDNEIHIVGSGQAVSRGLKAGMVTNITATAQAIKQAVTDAELMADCKISSVVTGIAGSHIRSLNSQGVVKIRDGEVTQADLDRAFEGAKTVNIPPEHKILHTTVQEYIIDNQPGVKDPIGMSGVRLDARVHIVTGAITALQNIQKCINHCGLEVDQVMLQPLASGQAVLTEDEKDLGVCVIDIGGGTTDIAVYTNGAIRHTAVIPVAGNLMTSDLAQALRTPLTAAEYIKIHYGAAHPDLEGLDDMVEVPSVGERRPRQTPRRVVASVIGARAEEIFELTLKELRASGFPEDVLTSGVVLTGGAAALPGMIELAEDIFGVPVRIGVPNQMLGVSENIRNPRFSTVIGLLESAREQFTPLGAEITYATQKQNSFNLQSLKNLVKRWFEATH